MILSDTNIAEWLTRRELVIEPPGVIQPASIDLHLGNEFMVFNGVQPMMMLSPFIHDPLVHDSNEFMVKLVQDTIVIPPKNFVLGVTKQRVSLPSNLAGRLDGKSSLARLGLLIHCTGGNIDPGFDGNITLEIYNVAPCSIMLTAGMAVAQLVLHQLSSPCTNAYQGRYQGDASVAASRYHQHSCQHDEWIDVTPISAERTVEVCASCGVKRL